MWEQMPHIRLQLPSAPCMPPERQRDTVNEDKTPQSSAVLTDAHGEHTHTRTHISESFVNVYINIKLKRYNQNICNTFFMPTSQSHLPLLL